MKIIILLTRGFQTLDGGSLRVLYLSRYLMEEGHFINFIVPSKDDSVGIDKRFQNRFSNQYKTRYSRFLPQGNISSKRRYLVYFIMKFLLSKVLNSVKADLVYCQNLPSAEVLISSRNPAPKILDIFDLWSHYANMYKNPLLRNILSRYLKWRECKVFQKMDHLVSCTPLTKKIIGDTTGIVPEKITVISDGVDLSLFQKRPKNDELRKKLGFAPQDFIITFHGGIKKHDGLHLLLEAIAIIKNSVPIKAQIIGMGNECDNLKLLAKRLGILDRVKFIGTIEHESVPDYLSISQAGIITRLTWQGDIAASMMECMASSLPVISSRIEGIEDYFTDRCDVLLFQIGDASDLSKSIIELYSDEKLYSTIQNNARKSISRFDRKRNAQEIAQFLKKFSGKE